ncbi:MAG: ATP synthase F1 subunit epsilon [Acutalibacteraceae bacterium]
METFDLKIFAADRVFFEGKCESLVIHAMDGEKGILAHHENILMAVNNGMIRFKPENGEEQKALSGLGFVEVLDNEVLLLVQTCERPDEIDQNRALRAKERAEEKLRQKSSVQEHLHSEAALKRAIARINFAGNSLK